MRVDQSRNDGSSIKIDDARLRPGKTPDLLGGTNCTDSFPSKSDRPRWTAENLKLIYGAKQAISQTAKTREF